MKTLIIVLIAALTLIAGADKPKSPPAVKALRTYGDSVRAVDEEHRQSMNSAQDEYRKQLKEASDVALGAKDLNAANEIEAALKAIAKKKPFAAPTFQLAIEAQRTHEDSVQAANEQQRDGLKEAEEIYLKEMQVGLDAAIVAKDLAEANRIDGAMKEMQHKIDARHATDPLVVSGGTNSIGMTFVLIPADDFLMGSPRSETDPRPDEVLHKVTLTQSIEMGTHEVTQAQYESVMGTNPSAFTGSDNPVEQVSWHDAVEFCLRLSDLPEEKAAGNEYRLPTEAEWEYACRAGTTTNYSFGANASKLGDYAWFDKNSGGSTHPVGKKSANRFGLYDMHGNVWEWCQDWQGDLPSGPVSDPQGPSLGKNRSDRGGGFSDTPVYMRSALRGYLQPEERASSLGFRVVR